MLSESEIGHVLSFLVSRRTSETCSHSTKRYDDFISLASFRMLVPAVNDCIVSIPEPYLTAVRFRVWTFDARSLRRERSSRSRRRQYKVESFDVGRVFLMRGPSSAQEFISILVDLTTCTEVSYPTRLKKELIQVYISFCYFFIKVTTKKSLLTIFF